MYEIFGHTMPNSVFVNEQNLVELPKIEVYYKKRNEKTDLLLLTGDVQPIDEESSYEFTEDIIKMSKKYDVDSIITLGGIGLGEIPKNPRVFCTGNNKELINSYKKETNINTKVYGVVGPIVGVSGLLLGLGQKHNIKAISLLTETLGHPMYLGIKAARETLKVLDKKLDLKLDIKKLDKEINTLDKQMKMTEKLSTVSKRKKSGSLNYIG